MATTMVYVHEAKTHLSTLLERVAGGEEAVIARNGERVARLLREALYLPRCVPGGLEGVPWVEAFPFDCE